MAKVKKNYRSPEAELLCFAAREDLASVDWESYKITAYALGDGSASNVDVTLPSNPEGEF